MLIGSLRDLSEAPWKELLEPLIVFDQVLAADPAKAYAPHGLSRAASSIAIPWPHFAEHSDCSELEIAQHGAELARDSQKQPHA